MKNLKNIKNVYFLGIGGIGMSALARYFKFTGRNVAGYDKTETALTKNLVSEGIDVHYDDDVRYIPKNWNPAETLAIFTPALPDDHNELSWFRNMPIGLLKRAKVLGLICNSKNGIAVAGTHGKTTTSSMVANILSLTKTGCGAFLGGIAKNFGSNLVLPKEQSPWIVVEADEFDRSFLHLQPQLALVTSVDADHLDIYGDKENIEESFATFVSQVKPDGKLVVKNGINTSILKNVKAEIYTYSIHKNSDFQALNLMLNENDGTYHFDLKTPDGIIANCNANYPGLVNVENAVGAASLAWFAGASANEIKQGILSYQGVARRFDIRLKTPNNIYIDDYAHHPAELKAVISSVKKLYPNKKLTGIFQPHLFSRTRDFANEFAKSLDMLDLAILIPIYPAREEPIEGVSSKIIFDKMKLKSKFLIDKNKLVGLLKNNTNEVVLTMGAGDIDQMAPEIIECLKKLN